jgi:hypothetical protein
MVPSGSFLAPSPSSEVRHQEDTPVLHFVKKKGHPTNPLGGGRFSSCSTQRYEISVVVTTLHCNSHHKCVTECNHPVNQAINH